MRSHVETLMAAAPAACFISSYSVSVVSTRTKVERLASSETGGRPIRGPASAATGGLGAGLGFGMP